MNVLDSIPFEHLLWLVPIFLTIHNFEEAPFMAGWIKRLPIKLPFQTTTRQFGIAVTAITIAAFLLTYLGVEYLANQIGYLIVLALQVVMLFNAFVPHIAMTIWFRMYSPGVITAVLLLLPFSCYLFQRAFTENLMTWKQFWSLLGISPFVVMISVFLSLGVGKIFDKNFA